MPRPQNFNRRAESREVVKEILADGDAVMIGPVRLKRLFRNARLDRMAQ